MNKTNNIQSIYQHLLDYIKGKRRGIEANKIERRAMSDLFLGEALEGMDSINDNHVKNIENLHEKIMQRAKKHNRGHRKIMFWGVAASVNVIFTWSAAACAGLLIAGGFIYFATSGSNNTGEFTIYDNAQLHYNNDFLAKAHNAEKEIIPEEYLSLEIIEPPMPQASEMRDIESQTLEIIEKHTQEKDILDFKADSIVAESQKIAYIAPQKLEPETYVDENIPFAVVEEYPKFMGKDANSFKDWIQKNIRYPENADCIQGKVVLTFVVDVLGNVTNVNVIKKLSPECDSEAVRVVSSSPRWTPAKQKSIPVDFEFTFSIVFKLN